MYPEIYVGLPGLFTRWPAEICIEELEDADTLFILGGTSISIREERGLHDFELYFPRLGARLHELFVEHILIRALETGRVVFSDYEGGSNWPFKYRIDEMLWKHGMSRIAFFPESMYYQHIATWISQTNPYARVHVPSQPMPAIVTGMITDLTLEAVGPDRFLIHVRADELPFDLQKGDRVGLQITTDRDNEAPIYSLVLPDGTLMPKPEVVRRNRLLTEYERIKMKL